MKAQAPGNGETASRKPCPLCGKQSSEPHSPFCSRRCADIDLGRWLKGNYAIPAREQEEDDDGEDRGGDEPARKGRPQP